MTDTAVSDPADQGGRRAASGDLLGTAINVRRSRIEPREGTHIVFESFDPVAEHLLGSG
jgi:hypothetical protein